MLWHWCILEQFNGLLKYFFKLARTCHKECNLTKELRNINFKNKISMKFYTYKNNNNEKSFLWILQVCFKIMMFILYDK
jgi:hypothetical protein